MRLPALAAGFMLMVLTLAPAPADELSKKDQTLLNPLREAISAGDFADGLDKARQIAPKVSREGLPELCMTVGDLYKGKGDDVRAALAWMRVVVHFPEHARAPEAMLRVAEVHEKIKRPEVAKALYDVLANGRYKSSAQAAPAREALKRLGG
jgi:hypothetical protein